MSDIVAQKLQELRTLRRKIIGETPDQALDIILDQKQPEILVQSFNPEDLHILIKEIGVEDALPVVQMASDAQWEYILDVESWAQDRLDVKAVSVWMRYLYLADPQRFVKHALDDNLELVEAWLKHNIDVFIRENDDDDVSQLSHDYFTIDDIFFVRVKPDGVNFMPDSMGDLDRAQFIQDFLNRLADTDFPKYQGLLLETISLMSAETEEQLYRVKTGRLEEKGIPAFENALSIYSMLPADRLAKRRQIQSLYTLNPPVLPGVLAANQARPVADLSPAQLTVPEDFEQEFATLVNSIMVADQIRINERSDMELAVTKAMGYLRIAFEVLERDQKLNPVQAANLYPTQQLFTLGFSQALALKWQAQSWLKQSFIADNKLGVKFFDEEGMGVLSGLHLKRPMYFDNLTQAHIYRDFASLNDISVTADILQEVIGIDTLLKHSGISIPADLKKDESYPLTWKNLLLTMWVRHEEGQEANLNPVAIDTLQNFWPRLFIQNEIKAGMRKRFDNWLMKLAQIKIPDMNLQRALNKLFNELQDGYAAVDASNLDARHIVLFRIINN